MTCLLPVVFILKNKREQLRFIILNIVHSPDEMDITFNLPVDCVLQSFKLQKCISLICNRSQRSNKNGMYICNEASCGGLYRPISTVFVPKTKLFTMYYNGVQSFSAISNLLCWVMIYFTLNCGLLIASYNSAGI